MKYRGKSTYLIGGDTPCYDKIGNEIPCPGKEMKNTSDNGQWTKINQPTPPMNSPQANPSDLTHESGTRNQFEVVSPQHNKKDKIDPLFGLLGATTGLEWLSGAAERKRQNQYMYNQFDQLNQTNPMPATDFQPNPYSLYSKYGGKVIKQLGGLPMLPIARKMKNVNFNYFGAPQQQLSDPMNSLTSMIGMPPSQEGADFNAIVQAMKANQYQMKKGGWIQKAVKHPGRCTPGSPNYDCPEGSPQWNLAQVFKRNHGFHRGKKNQ